MYTGGSKMTKSTEIVNTKATRESWGTLLTYYVDVSVDGNACVIKIPFTNKADARNVANEFLEACGGHENFL